MSPLRVAAVLMACATLAACGGGGGHDHPSSSHPQTSPGADSSAAIAQYRTAVTSWVSRESALLRSAARFGSLVVLNRTETATEHRNQTTSCNDTAAALAALSTTPKLSVHSTDQQVLQEQAAVSNAVMQLRKVLPQASGFCSMYVWVWPYQVQSDAAYARYKKAFLAPCKTDPDGCYTPDKSRWPAMAAAYRKSVQVQPVTKLKSTPCPFTAPGWQTVWRDLQQELETETNSDLQWAAYIAKGDDGTAAKFSAQGSSKVSALNRAIKATVLRYRLLTSAQVPRIAWTGEDFLLTSIGAAKMETLGGQVDQIAAQLIAASR